MNNFLSTKRNLLITGGTGSLGSALVRRWYKYHHVTVLSRDWSKQERLAAECPGVRFILADICDYNLVKFACSGQDILIHSAALKHVGIGEQNPLEYIRVNIEGTATVARAWQESHEPRKALYINSDKSVAGLNLYGGSKFCGEKIAIAAGFSSIRYGNVINSNGAFIQVWRDRIAQGLPVKVRIPAPTRFALTLEQAVDLVEDALDQEPGIYIPHSLPSFSIHDIASLMGGKVEYEPLLQGEKQHEILINEQEKAIRVSDLLARVVHKSCKEDGMGIYRFSSMTAPRTDGREILRWLENKNGQL